MDECKHEWQVVRENPYCPIPFNDSWGNLCQFVCVCLKCNKFKTIIAERISEQINFEYGEGLTPPALDKGEKLGDEKVAKDNKEN